MALSRFGSANLVHSELRPNGPSNTASRHRLWAKSASRRAQGWAGENGDHYDKAMNPSQVT